MSDRQTAEAHMSTISVIADMIERSAYNKYAQKVNNFAYTSLVNLYTTELGTYTSSMSKSISAFSATGNTAKATDLKTKLTEATNGKMRVVTFNSVTELRHASAELSTKDIFNVCVGGRMLHQHCLIISEDNEKDLSAYCKTNGITYSEYKGYNLYAGNKNFSTGNFSLDNSLEALNSVGDSNISSFQNKFYYGDSTMYNHDYNEMNGYASVHRTRVSIERLFTGTAQESKTMKKLQFWSDSENCVSNINSYRASGGTGTVPPTLFETKNVRIMTDASTGNVMPAEDMFKAIDSTHGTGILSGTNVAENIITARKKIMSAHPTEKCFTLGGGIDMNVLWQMKNGTEPTSLSKEEINFLLATAETEHGGQKFSFGIVKRTLAKLSPDELRSMATDMKRLVAVIQNARKISRAGARFVTKNADFMAVAVRTRKGKKTPDKWTPTAKVSKKYASPYRPSKVTRCKQKIRGAIVKKASGVKALTNRLSHWFYTKTLIGRTLDLKNRTELAVKQWLLKTRLGKFFKSFVSARNTIIAIGCGIVASLLLTSIILNGGGAIISTISGLFEVDSIATKLYDALEDEQTEWLEAGADEENAYRNRSRLMYGDDYLPLSEYVNSDRFTDNGVSVLVLDEDGKTLYTNPFSFVPSDGNALKKVKGYDGSGNEWIVESARGCIGTSNIKEIMSMTDAMYFNDLENSSDSKIHQTMGDTWISADWNAIITNRDNFYKRIGCLFTGEDYENVASPQMANYQQVKTYALGLFEMTHQEKIELIPEILPMSLCPEHGCKEYDDIRYAVLDGTVTPCIMGADGNLHNIGDCDIDDESCISASITPSEATWSKYSGNKCWTLAHSPAREVMRDSADSGDMFTGRRETSPKKVTYYMTGAHSIVKRTTWTETSYVKRKTTIKTVRTVMNEDGTLERIEKVEDDYIEIPLSCVYVAEDTLTWECKGHKGRYCGGHVSAKVKGTVYGITGEMLGEDFIIPEKLKVDYTSVESAVQTNLNIMTEESNGTRKWITSKLFGALWLSFDTDNALDTIQSAEREGRAIDIFDVDLSISYGSLMFPCNGNFKSFKSWNKDNIEMALTKYNQDWQKLYGKTFEENIGTPSLSESDINTIITEVSRVYGGLSSAREKGIRLALGSIGKGSYDTEHHDHAYKWERCNGAVCHVTDNSGFASYIALSCGKTDRVMNAEEFGVWYGTDLNVLRPCDMIYKNGHVQVFIGCSERDITLSNGITILANTVITADCTVFNGIGNIYLRNCNTLYGFDSFDSFMYWKFE